MQPILFEIFGIEIPAWHTLVMAAALLSFAYAHFFLKRINDDTSLEELPILFVIAYVSGWFGARTLGIFLEEPDRANIAEFFPALLEMGPMVFYGGVVAGAIFVVATIFLRNLGLARLFDVAVPTTSLGLGVGRIGCFLNGCDYGAPAPSGTHAWWTHANPVLADNIARYPTQLEEATFSIILSLIVAIIVSFWPKWVSRRGGILGSAVLIATALHRFVNEFFRGDFRGQFFGTTLSTSQGISLILAGIGLFTLIFRLLKRKASHDILV
jgi:phosphatidylglycerol:prolipoprotein diacylglycerol transferase